MRKQTLTWVLSGVLAVSTLAMTATATAGGNLADRHAQRGTDCVACHNTKAPKAGAVVKQETCLKCHGSLDQVAQRTKKLDPNPHYNHLVGLDCLECHRGHQKSVNMCGECHNLKFNVP